MQVNGHSGSSAAASEAPANALTGAFAASPTFSPPRGVVVGSF